MTDFDPTMPEESEQLDQLQSDDSLIDRGVDDVLDEGYVAPEKWSPAQTFGNTAAEMRHGETLDQRIAQEEPDSPPDPPEKWSDESEGPRQVGHKRAGRLVDADGGYGVTDVEPESIGHEVGFAGGAASAEEAAMHIIDDYEDDDDDN